MLTTLALLGCARGGDAAPTNPGGFSPEAFASRLAKTESATGPDLLAAHVLQDRPSPEFPAPGSDEIQLVFSSSLDPTSVVGEGFLVLGADGRRTMPARAMLAPADEVDEGRAVVLQGDFGEGAPSDVRVLGHVRTKDGRSLRGAVVSVSPLWEPPRLLLAYRVVPTEGRCGDAKAAIRTWWSQPIAAPLADSQVRRFEVRRADGERFAPLRADDHTHAPSPNPQALSPKPQEPLEGALTAAAGPSDDAVLDLCFDEGAVGGVIHVPAGVVIGRSGRAAEAQSLPLTDNAAGKAE